MSDHPTIRLCKISDLGMSLQLAHLPQLVARQPLHFLQPRVRWRPPQLLGDPESEGTELCLGRVVFGPVGVFPGLSGKKKVLVSRSDSSCSRLASRASSSSCFLLSSASNFRSFSRSSPAVTSFEEPATGEVKRFRCC